MEARAPPWLEAQLDYLRTHATSVPLRVEQLRSGSRKGRCLDRFTLLVPCCLVHVKWEVVYNGLDARVPPDIIFPSDDDKFQPLNDVVDSAPSPPLCSLLQDWTANDPSRLFKLIMVMRALYLQYQRKKVEAINDSRVRFELNTLSGLQGLEMCVVTASDWSEEVNFAVPLVLEVEATHVGTPRAPASAIWRDISLQVKFPVQKGQAAGGAPQLKLVAPLAMREVFDVDDVKLPALTGSMCLMEYIPSLQHILQQQVREARVSVSSRRTFMEALFPLFGRPLEADATYCRRISLVASSGVFTFLVHFALPIQFPKLQPTLTFQSSQHFDLRGKPLVSRPYQDYPWSPRWDAAHMAQRIFDFVAEECGSFKKYCNELLQHQR